MIFSFIHRCCSTRHNIKTPELSVFMIHNLHSPPTKARISCHAKNLFCRFIICICLKVRYDSIHSCNKHNIRQFLKRCLCFVDDYTAMKKTMNAFKLIFRIGRVTPHLSFQSKTETLVCTKGPVDEKHTLECPLGIQTHA